MEHKLGVDSRTVKQRTALGWAGLGCLLGGREARGHTNQVSYGLGSMGRREF